MSKIKLIISKYISVFKKEGFQGVLKQGGWKIVIGLFLFFLLKGIAWIVVPYFIFKGVA